MSYGERLSELKGDLLELESILEHATRSNVRNLLANELSHIKTNIETVEKQQKKAENSANNSNSDNEQKPGLFTTKITNFGADESPKFYKLYLSLPNIKKLSMDQIKCEFTDCSFTFVAYNHLGKNHELKVVKLAYNIDPAESTCKLKSGNVIISLRKVESKTWGHLTEAERKETDLKKSKYDTQTDDDVSSDPSAGIMNLMKKMYDEGDDDTKRMIKKTWYESQQKQMQGGGGGMPEF